MILVTGATGHLGRAVIQTLLQKVPASQIAVFVRDAGKATDLQGKGVNIRVGDYDDVASIDEAMKGVDKVLLISGGDAKNGLEQHQNVVDAAKRASVKCIAYTGRCLKNRETLVNELMNRHFQTEDYIKASGLNYILFRNILYMDVLPIYLGDKVLDTGIHLPAGEGKASYALRSEMGEAIANVLSENDCDNKIYDFTNSEFYSFDDAATALSELSGREVKYSSVSQAEFEELMKARGLPDVWITRLYGFLTDIKNGQESTVSTDLESKLGRKPTPLKEGLKMLLHL